jgi:hypothetical protein
MSSFFSEDIERDGTYDGSFCQGEDWRSRNRDKEKTGQERTLQDTTFLWKLEASCWPGKIKIWSLHTYHKSSFRDVQIRKKQNIKIPTFAGSSSDQKWDLFGRCDLKITRIYGSFPC